MAVNYKKIANEVRRTVLDMIYKAQSSHIGSNFSAIDFLTVLYEKTNLKEDKIIYSKGWIAASAYAFLARRGVIRNEDLDTYCQDGSKFIGLLEPTVPGIECAGGSMGYGLPFGVGFALAKKLKKKKGNVYVIMSDGEQAIGTTWESALIAAHHKLDNLVVIVDNNGFQAMGKTEDILNLENLQEKWGSFGWNTELVDGHDYRELEESIFEPSDLLGLLPDMECPKVVIADTIKGKGVSFMENNNLYHYKNLSEIEYEAAKQELE